MDSSGLLSSGKRMCLGKDPHKTQQKGDTVVRLNPGKENNQLSRFRSRMNRMVVGQPKATDRITDSFSRLIAGIHDPERPLLTMMFMGPTGVGKTETVRCLAETIFGDRRAYTRINCQEYSAHYNISKLLGSPPGYVGGEIRPLLSQENLDRHHIKAREKNSGMISESDSKLADIYQHDPDMNLNIVLFDEVEKAHPKMWNTLLGILEDGHLVLANNEEVDFTRSIIILTTNVGSEAMNKHLSGGNIGFSADVDGSQLDQDIETVVEREAKKVFPMEFLNRFDNLITYHTLKDEHLHEILNNQIAKIHHRSLMSSEPFLLEISNEAKRQLVAEGTNPEYGARPLTRVVEKRIITPISRYICSDQIKRGDMVKVGYDGTDYAFDKEEGLDLEVDIGTAALQDQKWARTDLGVRDDGGEKKKLEEENSDPVEALAMTGMLVD
jgi:ATP-dependent Clp protease ATP-binding subunit ClpA